MKVNITRFVFSSELSSRRYTLQKIYRVIKLVRMRFDTRNGVSFVQLIHVDNSFCQGILPRCTLEELSYGWILSVSSWPSFGSISLRIKFFTHSRSQVSIRWAYRNSWFCYASTYNILQNNRIFLSYSSLLTDFSPPPIVHWATLQVSTSEVFYSFLNFCGDVFLHGSSGLLSLPCSHYHNRIPALAVYRAYWTHLHYILVFGTHYSIHVCMITIRFHRK